MHRRQVPAPRTSSSLRLSSLSAGPRDLIATRTRCKARGSVEAGTSARDCASSRLAAANGPMGCADTAGRGEARARCLREWRQCCSRCVLSHTNPLFDLSLTLQPMSWTEWSKTLEQSTIEDMDELSFPQKQFRKTRGTRSQPSLKKTKPRVPMHRPIGAPPRTPPSKKFLRGEKSSSGLPGVNKTHQMASSKPTPASKRKPNSQTTKARSSPAPPRLSYPHSPEAPPLAKLLERQQAPRETLFAWRWQPHVPRTLPVAFDVHFPHTDGARTGSPQDVAKLRSGLLA